MLLRGLRLEGDCFPSDKNHLAPSEEPASQRRTELKQAQHSIAASLALARLQRTLQERLTWKHHCSAT
ncbi:hypothetical protein PBY51_001353 [Eleginops maclovinus]|uniref:Uncharacterized protein n=1 Tax=Eleginops maclovinus TaxID=56733 RepID=A0AAN7WPF4_ELEMC|nr:hypothetical protein PBY51_001353 [Eleginops maclovinus]